MSRKGGQYAVYCICPFNFSTKEKLARFECLSKFDGVMSCVKLGYRRCFVAQY